MNTSISMRYGLKSLRRHFRRTVLSVIGIGLGCAVCLFVLSFVRGESGMMMRAAGQSGAGHIRVVPKEWVGTRENKFRLSEWKDTLAAIRGMNDVVMATPRARTDALLAFGTRMTGVEMVGVDPETEQPMNRLVQNVIAGRYLTADDKGATVIGRAIAKRLDVEVEDDLMVTVAGKDGQMNGAMLHIVGIVATGSRELDATICHVVLADVERISGYDGAGEITLTVSDPDTLDTVYSQIAALAPPDSAVMTWREIIPELAASAKVDETWSRLIVGIITTVVFLGIASAQLAAVLERRREFAVLAALGMKSGRLVMIMLIEGVALGLLGTIAGLLFGVPCTYYIATKGLDFSAMYKEADLAVSNILVDPIIYGDFGWWLAPLALGLALTATILSSLYPAWFAVKTDPASALRVEQ